MQDTFAATFTDEQSGINRSSREAAVAGTSARPLSEPDGEHVAAGPPVVTPARVVAGVCLVVPIVLPLCVPLYDRITPTLGGIPFFYWWQILWVVITAGLVAVAYALVRHDNAVRRARAGTSPGSGPDAGPRAGDTGTEAGR